MAKPRGEQLRNPIDGLPLKSAYERGYWGRYMGWEHPPAVTQKYRDGWRQCNEELEREERIGL